MTQDQYQMKPLQRRLPSLLKPKSRGLRLENSGRSLSSSGMQRVERLYYHYTPAALEDELLYLLSSNTECDVNFDENGEWFIHPFHPYINQTEGLICKINIYEPIPKFVIWGKDMPPGLVNALARLGKVTMKRIITNAVRRLYESVDPEYLPC